MSSSARMKSSSSWNSWPTRLSASRWFGETRNGSAAGPEPQRLAFRVEHGLRCSRSVQVADRLGVEVVLDAARQRAREDDDVAPRSPGSAASRAASSSSSGSTCGPHSLISVYELAVGSTTAVDVRDSSAMRTKSLRIASPVSSSTMRVPGPAAGEAGRDDRHVEPLERPRDVDALAAGERQARRSRGAAGRAGSSARSASGRGPR